MNQRFKQVRRAACVGLAALLLVQPPLEAARRKKKSAEPPNRIRNINIVHKDIFDPSAPGENKMLFRLVNRLHVSTKDHVIRKEMLMKEGDIYNTKLARESERALRNVLALRRVRIRSRPAGEGLVDLDVEVQETWTTEPILSFSGVGGDLSGRIGLREKNLFGLGKSARFLYKKVDGTISRSFSYDDPNPFGTHLRLGTVYDKTEDGVIRSLNIGRPFYSTVTPWSVLYGFNSQDIKTHVHEGGEETQGFNQTQLDHNVRAAYSIDPDTDRIFRVGLFYRYFRDRSKPDNASVILREERFHALGPTLHWEEVNFITVEHVRQIDRDEDFNLGPSVLIETAVSGSHFQNASSAVFLRTKSFWGKQWSGTHFTLNEYSMDGRVQDGGLYSTRHTLDLEYYYAFTRRQTLAVHLLGDHIIRPAADAELLLGGGNGLRGYSLNYFQGNKMILANVEDRLFWLPDVFHLLGLGGVLFADSGYVWAPGYPVDLRDMKSDVGAGLRFHLTRASEGHVLRLDAGYALNPIPGKSRWVFTFGTSQVF